MRRFALGLGIGIITGVAGVVLLLTVLWRTQVSAAGAVAAPALLFENSRVKAWSLTLEPGQATPQHTHELDEIVICLESSKLRITKAGPEPEGQTMQPNVGDVFMPPVKGVTHVLTNVGETRYRQVSIELK
jgi:predicted metal-dependent enzyme (double-stranded beta helix superfamily)